MEISSPADDEITTDGEDIAVSNDGNSKLSATDDTILSEGEGQNDPKNYTGLTVDELTIDDEGASVYNCTIGNLTVNSANVNIFNNTLSNLILNGIKGNAYENTITGTINITGSNVTLNQNNIVGNVIVNGEDDEVSGNVIDGNVVLNNANAIIANNDISWIFSIENLMYNIVTSTITGTGNNIKIYNNTVSQVSLTGENINVSDNTITTSMFSMESLNLNGNGMVVCNNDLALSAIFSGDNAIIYGNTFMSIELYGDNAIIYDNCFNEEETYLTGENLIFHDNSAVKGMSIITYFIGNNFTVYNNKDFELLEVGEKDNSILAVIYNNNVERMNVKADNSIVYNNTLNGFGDSGDNCEVYNNTMGITTMSGNNVSFHDNYAGKLYIQGNNYDVYNNYFCLDTSSSSTASKITGNHVYIHNNTFDYQLGLTSNNITFENNTINSNEEFAITVSASGKNIYIKNNRLFGTEHYGAEAVQDLSGQNVVIEGNYPLQTILTITANNITVGESLTVKVTVSINGYPSKSIVQIIFNGNTYRVKTTGKTATKLFFDLPAGEYPIIAISEPYGNYGEGRNSTVIKVSKLNPTLELNTTEPVIGGDVNVTATISGATGNVTFIIDGAANDVELKEGVATYTISNVDASTHSIVAIYNGDDKNEAAFNSTAFTLEKSTPVVDIDVGDLKLGEDATVTVTIANATGKVNIIVDGVENLVDLNNGVATHTIEKVTAGTHTIVANYAGDDKLNAAFASTSKELKVLSTSFNVAVDGDLNIKAVLIDSEGKGVANANITYTMGNLTNTTVTDENGSFAIKGKEGAKVGISYAGSDLLFPTSTVVALDKIAPTRVDSSISASALNCYAVDYSAGERGALFKVTLKDAEGNAISDETVKVVLDNKVYDIKTDANGIASMNVNIEKAGTYVASLTFLGNDYKNSAFSTAKIVVKKKTTKLVAKAKTFKVKSKSKKYTATLKTIKGSSADGKIYLKAGKKVTLTVNKKTYTAKINKKGQVTFNLKKLTKKGTYKATIKFKGDNTYNGCTKKVKIKIK